MAPAVIALMLYSLLPVVRSTVAGLEQVPRPVVEAATGMGLTRGQVFGKVELPIALPVFLSGVRIAAVQAVGLAVVAALIGAGGLGALVFQGLASGALDLVLLGVIPVVALAVVVDAAFRLLVQLSGRAGRMIAFEHVGKAFAGVVAIDDLSLTIAEGEFVVVIGRSGSGKSTTLKMLNRLVEHDRGRIVFAGEEIRRFKPEELRRRMGYAIQSIGLFPHWTVEQNIATVPELLGWPRSRIRDRVTELMELLDLAPETYRGRYPHQLSGGQQQRVGVARALAGDPAVLLMDEPFGSLDPVTRESLQHEIVRIHKASGKTILFVTHDIDEALRLATRIVLLDHGRVVQVGTAREILEQPATDFVSDFVGRGDIGIKLLGLDTVAAFVRRGESAAGDPIAISASLREAMSMLVARRVRPAAGCRRRGAARRGDCVGRSYEAAAMSARAAQSANTGARSAKVSL